LFVLPVFYLALLFSWVVTQNLSVSSFLFSNFSEFSVKLEALLLAPVGFSNAPHYPSFFFNRLMSKLLTFFRKPPSRFTL